MFRLRRKVYLDNNATTRVSKRVADAADRCLRRCFGNPSSIYRVARDAAAFLDESRALVAQTINAEPHEIFFTSCATEANNTVLISVFENAEPKRRRILSTPIEHSSVMSTLEYLAARGCIVDFIPVNGSGMVDMSALSSLIDDQKPLVVCCMLANNEIGTLQDIPKVASIARARGIPILVDCVQALGKVPLDMKSLNIDFATFSAHKIHGPKGIGCMYVQNGRKMTPLLHGGHQESGVRAGTESIHNIVAFAAACSEIPRLLKKSQAVKSLTLQLAAGLKSIVPGSIVRSPPDGSCLPNTLSVTFPGVRNVDLMAILDYHGIAVSAGSACNSQDDLPSHVLKAIGLTDDEARQTLRFSLSTETTRADIRYTLRVLSDHFSGKTPPVVAITPAQLNEDLLLDPRTYILDIRFWYDRKLLKGLPDSHEASFVRFHKYAEKLPRDKHIIAVCQMGYNAPIVAYFLRAKGLKNVSFLLNGLFAWRLAHPELYKKMAGRNITKL
jgi:cysteine desulfurase